MGNKGGISSKAIVTQFGDGSKVRLSWEKDNEKCREANGFFWKNLEAILKPGGLQLGPHSTALKVGTGLLSGLAVYLLVVGLVWLSAFMALDLLDPLKGHALGATIGSLVFFIFALIASIYALRRRNWGWARGVSLALAILFGLSLLLLVTELGALASPMELVLRFVAALVCYILISRTKEEFA